MTKSQLINALLDRGDSIEALSRCLKDCIDNSKSEAIRDNAAGLLMVLEDGDHHVYFRDGGKINPRVGSVIWEAQENGPDLAILTA